MRLLTLAVMLAGSVGGPASAQDGQTVLQRMNAAYRSLTSLSYTLSTSRVQHYADRNLVDGTRSDVRYARPNLFYIRVTNPNPEQGRFVSVCDGRQQTSYIEKYNICQRRPAPGGIAGIVGNLAAYGVGQVANLPLQLLRGPLPPGRLSSPTRLRDASVNGVQCYVVRATYRNPLVFRGAAGRAAVFIGKADHLVRKVETEFAGMPTQYRDTVLRDGQPITVQRSARLDFRLTETVQEMRANVALGARDFAYAFPRAARDVAPQGPNTTIR